ncbi:hypothetical protein OF117_12110 [Geodermatophilus sp. YIM 151500]|uniref:hypothetical protein n=1 Tax=Geodermatophilus sp. YIM 151500 TaxID=2984531 RepID=UPI0021E41042|nr:hypothetical protein [Geodermatophilus sp. YIM 151500]MCV2490107.1 hypothetical protein [Geodermatophilus sp. YIM 151500]
MSALLYPAGEPAGLPDTMPVNGERMNIPWAVGVLMGNRDLVRRLTAETGIGTAVGATATPPGR